LILSGEMFLFGLLRAVPLKLVAFYLRTSLILCFSKSKLETVMNRWKLTAATILLVFFLFLLPNQTTIILQVCSLHRKIKILCSAVCWTLMKRILSALFIQRLWR